MILKEPEIPREILVMEALLRRLPEDHEMKQQIKADLADAKDKYEGMLRQHESSIFCNIDYSYTPTLFPTPSPHSDRHR